MRCAFSLAIIPGREEEYDRRHQEVWPELLQLLKESGFRNYSIFRRGSVLFAYMESEQQPLQAFVRMQEHPVQIKWRDYMSDVLVRDENMGFTFMDEVFHLE
ncbi:L-rhamnose mutarotase [Paenibacillus thalictri]|uniref:L-rhamnose mutarotase n=1 Tax=Paenibacillus thalictri TaxID=2527873 RepID=A0A4Q9DTC5_9BACL|nr:L-rhamnose mutarotase [Paenibacillus thalictri]TBL78612.1 L-rhamnose mutarotase [Paenibacillus thalictri]